jgi:hypothetical protein
VTLKPVARQNIMVEGHARKARQRKDDHFIAARK